MSVQLPMTPSQCTPLHVSVQDWSVFMQDTVASLPVLVTVVPLGDGMSGQPMAKETIDC